MSTLSPGLCVVEGIYGRDGDGFNVGTDYLTNLVMFGKDPFRVDVVGLYLGGHEPGNVHLYRIAKERGLSDTFNPWEIPVYEEVNAPLSEWGPMLAKIREWDALKGKR